MIAHRCFAWDRDAAAVEAGGPLSIPREFQGSGRHDNPELYGCLYLSVEPVAAVVEQLEQFRGLDFRPGMLTRRTLPLALAELELPEEARLIDLDEPRILARERLRPSLVATYDRDVTQSGARTVFTRHPDVAGISWWSTFESQWTNLTIFDRSQRALRVIEVSKLSPKHPALEGARAFLGLC